MRLTAQSREGALPSAIQRDGSQRGVASAIRCKFALNQKNLVNGPIAQFGHPRAFNGLASFASFCAGRFDAADGEVWLKSALVVVIAEILRLLRDSLLERPQRP